VVVGGGIAGCALATLLARAGIDCLVLERQASYRDRVRGEYLAPWGVEEARRSGLLAALVTAPGSAFVGRYVPYDEVHEPEVAERRASDLRGVLPGVEGALDLSHPGACEALAAAAVAAGARVARGVSDVIVTAGRAPRVDATIGGRRRRIPCRLVVGADGRRSVVRRQLGIRLRIAVPRTVGAGLLVAGIEGWPQGTFATGTEGGIHFFVFPRGDGHARLYLLHARGRGRPFAGRDGAIAFLRAFRLRCLPETVSMESAEAAGPCAAFPMHDSWTDEPFTDGAVLIGDAAGFNDPIIGQGLAIALRDARVVAELLGSEADWSTAAVRHYGAERAERMRRLRLTAALATDLRCTFTDEGRERRGRVFERFERDRRERLPLAAAVVGPDRLSAEVFKPEAASRLLR
jgi:2-polyprenyl-6-methoxyphenol hydroxylase-like FAD-dependent oxidoreductase